MSKRSGGLTRWFNEKWVDLSRPKEGGGYEDCGRPDASEGKYPKCVPAARAEKLTPEEIKSAIRRKRRAESTQDREGKKPIYVSTLKKENVPENRELYAKVKAEARRKFDVYPSAYANGWLVQEYKRRGGTYKTVAKDEPTSTDVHVPTLMNRQKRKKRRPAGISYLEELQKQTAPILSNGLGALYEAQLRDYTAAEKALDPRNNNPDSEQAKTNRKQIGQRAEASEIEFARRLAITRYNAMPPASDANRFEYSRNKRVNFVQMTPTGVTGRPGGDYGRGNHLDRMARKSRILREFGDGHTAPCIYCGIRLGWLQMEVDKLDPVMSYKIPENLVPSCKSCNNKLRQGDPASKLGVRLKRQFVPPPSLTECMALLTTPEFVEWESEAGLRPWQTVNLDRYRKRAGKAGPVEKHLPGQHDQQSHAGSRRRDQAPQGMDRRTARRAASAVSAIETDDTPKELMWALTTAGGFTWNPARNQMRRSGFAVAASKKNERQYDLEDFRKNGVEILRKYVRDHAEALGGKDAHLGAWVSNNKVYLDVSHVVSSVAEAAELGRRHNQIGLFDLGTFTEWRRHRSPTTGEYRYLDRSRVPRGKRWMVDELGKAASGVMFVPALALREDAFEAIVAELLSGPVSKHANHNQEDHGNRGGSRVAPSTSGGKASAKGRKPDSNAPVVARDIKQALTLISQGKDVVLKDVSTVFTLVDDFKRAWDKLSPEAQNKVRLNFCKISVPGTNLFCAQALDIPRVEMPQFSGKPRPGSKADKLPKKTNKDGSVEVDGTKQFEAWISKKAKVRRRQIKASQLKASQKELKGDKVAGMTSDPKFDPAGQPIFVSSDGYVIDGHHRWAAQVVRDSRDNRLGDLRLNVIEIDMPISRVLREAKSWSREFGIEPKSAFGKADQPLKDPKGGLTAAGRAHFKRTEGANLKPGVRGPADTPEKMRRKGSFLTRFFTNLSGPLVDEKGRPTRLALSANAWGEPVPKTAEDAARLAAKGRNLLERYKSVKKHYQGQHDQQDHAGGRGSGGLGASPKADRTAAKLAARFAALEALKNSLPEGSEQRNKVRDELRSTASDYAKSLFEMSGDTKKGKRWVSKVTEAAVNLDGTIIVTGEIFIEGDLSGQFLRGLSPRSGERSAEHIEMFMAWDQRGTGVGGAFVRETLKRYKRSGLRSVKLDAIYEDYGKRANGTAVWPKLGFTPKSPGVSLVFEDESSVKRFTKEAEKLVPGIGKLLKKSKASAPSRKTYVLSHKIGKDMAKIVDLMYQHVRSAGGSFELNLDEYPDGGAEVGKSDTITMEDWITILDEEWLPGTMDRDVQKNAPGKHDQKEHGIWAEGGPMRMGSGVGMARSVATGTDAVRRFLLSGKETLENARKRNDQNPNELTDKAKKNLESVGERVSLKEMRESRRKMIADHNSLREATDEDRKRYCQSKKANVRPGGELRGNAAARRSRKSRLLRRYGDGHTAGCAFCGIRVGFSTLTVEKLDPVMGYVDKNIVPSCMGCNQTMNQTDPGKKLGVRLKRKYTPPPTPAECANLVGGS